MTSVVRPSVSVEELVELYGPSATLSTIFSPSQLYMFILRDSTVEEYQCLDIEDMIQDLADSEFLAKITALFKLMYFDRRIGPLSRVVREKSNSIGISLRYLSDSRADRLYVSQMDILQVQVDRLTRTDDDKVLLECSIRKLNADYDLITDADISDIQERLDKVLKG